MNKKVLIVDDDPVSIQLPRRALEQAGYKVFYAVNGQEGLEVAERESPDIIVTDIIMPVMDGVDLFNNLKKSPRTSNIPIVVVTESSVIEESFRTLGINEFLAKPLDARKVLAKVKRIIEIKQSRFSKGKALLVGNDMKLLKEMESLLLEIGYTVNWTDESSDSISRALMLVPDVIFLDFLQKDISAKELVRALKSFVKLGQTKIIGYNSLTSDEVGNPMILDMLIQEKQACFDRGCRYYLGRFNRTNFIESFHETLKSDSPAFTASDIV